MQTRKESQVVAALAIVVTLISIFQFACTHYFVPLKQALNDSQSFYDLRGPYFGAIDLCHHADPYPAHPPSAVLARETYGVDRWSCLYSPIATSMYIPLTALPFPWAKAAWLTISVILLGISSWILIKAACGSVRNWGAVALIVFTVTNFEAGLRTLDMGQANTLILLFLCLTVVLLKREDEWLSGCTLALAALIKPIPAILLVWLILTKRFRALAAAMLTIVSAMALGIAFFGLDVHLSFLRTLSESAQDVSSWWCNQSLYGMLHQCLGGGWLNCPALAQPLWLVGCLSLLLLSTVTTLKYKGVPVIMTWSLWLVTGLIISTRSWDHYFLWLLIPISALMWDFVSTHNLKGLVWLIVDYCILSFSVLNLANLPTLHHGPLILIMNLGTAGLLLLYGLLTLAHRVEPVSQASYSLCQSPINLSNDD